MKAILFCLITLFAVSNFAFADEENLESAKVKDGHDLMGNKKETKTYKKKVKGANGEGGEEKVTKTTTHKKGKTETKVKVDEDATKNN